MTNRVGQRFGDYRLIRFLGEGTFGDVYSGFQPKGEEDAYRMRSRPSGNFGWSSFTR